MSVADALLSPTGSSVALGERRHRERSVWSIDDPDVETRLAAGCLELSLRSGLDRLFGMCGCSY